MRSPCFVLLLLLCFGAPAFREAVLDLVSAVSRPDPEPETGDKPGNKGDKGSEMDPDG
jgi:hypothetical protein